MGRGEESFLLRKFLPRKKNILNILQLLKNRHFCSCSDQGSDRYQALANGIDIGSGIISCILNYFSRLYVHTSIIAKKGIAEERTALLCNSYSRGRVGIFTL